MLTSHGRHRLEELDSLRGFAAVIVLFGHLRTFWNPPYPVWWTRLTQSPLGLLQSGPDAVYVFFVMSGFVLFLPYMRPGGPDSYPRYLVKRVCRIYLPYLAALFVSVAADLAFFRPVAELFPQWANWHRPFPVSAFWQNILFIGHSPIGEFNPAFWSLVHEMRISLFYPLIAWMVLRVSLLTGVLIGLAICSGGFLLAGLLQMDDLSTLGYSGLFILGGLLARHLTVIRGLVKPKGTVVSATLFVLAISFFKATHLLPTRYYQWWTIVPLHGLGAALIVLLALTSPSFRHFLHLRCLRWLGRVSYSIYLLHGVVLYSVASLFWTSTRHHLLLMLGGSTLALVLSSYFHHWVERPSTLLGRRLTEIVWPPLEVTQVS